MIRVLIAEDSPVVRRLLADMIGSDPRFTIAGLAEDGVQAVQMAACLEPDIITMDTRMPHVDGVEATERIMAARACPIVVISSNADTDETSLGFRALRAGALDIVQKPEGTDPAGLEKLGRSITDTLALMAEVKVIRRRPRPRTAMPPSASGRTPKVIGICASTGGPPALESILRSLPRAFPVPILIVQHITPGFTTNLVRWLQLTSAIPVHVARAGELLRAGHAYVAPDDRHLFVEPGGVLALSDALPVRHHRPSGDILFASLARVYGPGALGIILTGMGSDGVAGLRALHARGGRVLAQDEATCVIESMPRSAVEAGVVQEILGLRDLPRRLAELATARVAVEVG